MEKYIQKDAIVAEIERRKQKLLDHIICESDKEWAVRTAHQLNRIIQFCNTLEVKGVDLDKHINKYFKGWYVDLTDQGNILHSPDGQAGLMSVKKVAKHFFELGLKAQKGEEV